MNPFVSKYAFIQKEIANVDDAIKKAMTYKGQLEKIDPNNVSDLQALVISLSRVIVELEHEWS